MSKKRASQQPAVKLNAACLLDVTEFFFEAVDIGFVEPDAILERAQAFGDTGIVGLRPETHILLRSELLFRNVQLDRKSTRLNSSHT